MINTIWSLFTTTNLLGKILILAYAFASMSIHFRGLEWVVVLRIEERRICRFRAEGRDSQGHPVRATISSKYC